MSFFNTVELWAGRSRWRRRWASFAAGAVSILAMAPFHVWPVLWLTLPVLLRLMAQNAAADAAARRWQPWLRVPAGRAAETGWWFGFGYHMFGLFWIGEAFLVEAEIFGWLLPVAVTALPAGLALFWAGAAAATQSVRCATAVERVVVLALCVAAAEWLRGHIFTGFPWNIVGYALTAPLPLMQAAGLFGVYGLTLIAVLIFALAEAMSRDAARRGVTDTRWLQAARIAAVSVLPLALLWGYGSFQLARYSEQALQTDVPIKVRLVQPSVKQRDKWRPEHQRRIFDQHLLLSQTAPDGTNDGARGVDLIVWPESAMPFFPLEQPIALAEIGEMLPPGAWLAAGGLRQERGPDGQRRVFNSLMIYGPGATAQVAGIYDKIHLVPFGEYLPLQRVLEFVWSAAAFADAGWLCGRGCTAAVFDVAEGRPAFAAGLLRGNFPVGGQSRGGATAGDAECHQRWLVRRYHRAAAAFTPSARARGRRGRAAHSCSK